jgi:hypothetical protein
MTAQDVAQWMLDQVTEHGRLHQSKAAYAIRDQFGSQHTYKNRSGNWAIDDYVLKAFLRLSGNTVVWEQGELAWRPRREGDKPGRRQQ